MKTPDSEPDNHDEAWDDLFRQRLADYTDQPPADALNRILLVANPPRPARRWAVSGAVVLLLLSVGSWFALHNPEKPTQMTVSGAARLAVHSFPRANAPAAVPAVGESPTNMIAAKPQTTRNGLPAAVTSGRRLNARATVKAGDADARTPAEQVVIRMIAPLERTPSARPASSARLLTKLNRVDKQIRLWGHSSDRVSYVVPPGYGVTQPARRDGTSVPVAEYSHNASARQTVVQDALVEPAVVPQSLDLLAGQPFCPFRITASLPGVSVPSATPAKPLASRQHNRPAVFASVTPLYNYAQIDPIHTDREFVSNVRGAQPLATDRLGGRLQLGLEWPLTRRLRLRTSVVYQQMQQSLRYAVRSVNPDSVRIVLVDAQSVRVTPVFAERSYAQTTTWHYAGLSSDVVWQLNRSGRWQHYLTAGATAGGYVNAGKGVTGFVQASYGFERPLTAGMRLRVEPSVQVGWQAVTDPSQRLQTRPYGYGLSLGLRFR